MKVMIRFMAVCLMSNFAFSQDYPSPPHQQSSSIPGARFEVIQSQLAAKWTFRLDRFSGRVWQLVKTKESDNAWEEMFVYNLPKSKSMQRPRFQLFISSLAARHTFLIDTDTGSTWVVTTSSGINSWQPFVE